jgi:hypothetical protein
MLETLLRDWADGTVMVVEERRGRGVSSTYQWFKRKRKKTS